jgi:hypothetical protein
VSGELPLSIVLPVYNQGDHIGDILRGYIAALSNLRHDFELIVVVNASTDDSLKECEGIARVHPCVRVLHDPAPGWGRAVRRGIAAARGDLIAYANTARTPPHALCALIMLGYSNPGYLIKAERKLRFPVLRRIGSVLYNFQCRALFSLAVWDVNGTPKVFARSFLPPGGLREEGDLIDLELLVHCERSGIPVLEVPVVSPGRHSGRSTTMVPSALKMYAGAFRLWREMRRASAVLTDRR